MKRNILIIIIFVLVLATAVLFTLFYLEVKQTKNIGVSTPTPTPQQETPTMMLSFTPNIISVKPNGNFSAQIQFDSFGNPVNKIIISISYDPSQVTNIKFTPVKDPVSSLSYAFNLIAGSYSTNPTAGTISETLIIPKTIPAPRGRGIIAKFTGRLAPGIKNTTIRFAKDSLALSPTLNRVVLGKVNLEINTK